MNDDNSFILFYSNYCKHCKDFLVKLRDMDFGLFNKFRKICVDDNQNLPSSITSVPTIITPTHDQPLTDSAVFLWLDTLADNYISQTASQTGIDSSRPINNDETKEISPFIENEMGGKYSDNFSFLDTEPLAGPLAHNFSFIEEGNNQIEQHSNNNINMPNNMNISNNMNMPNNRTLSQLDFQLDRPTMSEKVSSGFDQEFDSLKNTRDNDPYIRHAPQRR